MESYSAFMAVYNVTYSDPFLFEMGNCTECEEGSDVAGATYNAHEIRFAGLSNQSDLKRRNLVVHELGHAFYWAILNKTGIDVYSSLGEWRTNHPGYPDRLTFTGSEKQTGPSYGFASLQNQTTWQQSLVGSNNEEFADQFLGWTFNKWETENGTLHPRGSARAAMMNTNMPLWVNMAAGNR